MNDISLYVRSLVVCHRCNAMYCTRFSTARCFRASFARTILTAGAKMSALCVHHVAVDGETMNSNDAIKAPAPDLFFLNAADSGMPNP